MKLSAIALALVASAPAMAAPFDILRHFAETLSTKTAPLLSSTSAQDTEHLPNDYIVVFHPHVSLDMAVRHSEWVGDLHHSGMKKRQEQAPFGGSKHSGDSSLAILSGIKHLYDFSDLHESGFKGYSGQFSEETLEAIRKHPDVAYVERDQVVHASSIEKSAPWGLARISHRDALGFSTFNKYAFDSHGGEGVKAYVIDTGINIAHTDFEGRASWGKTLPDDDDVDGNGHGSHVAGTIAGKRYGVAKGAEVIAVKVLTSSGSGSMSDVLAGVEWAAKSHVKDARSGSKSFKGSVANLSLGGGKSNTLDEAINAAAAVGMHFAVAAGNENQDACNVSPAAAEGAITVGASTLGDDRAYFSNWGRCVDIFAPGLNIMSTWTGDIYATNVISGTSMASPHIAGLAAYLLSLHPDPLNYTTKQLKKDMIKSATIGVLSDLPEQTTNLLAYNGFLNETQLFDH